MRSLVSLTFLFALSGWAQTPATQAPVAQAPAAQSPAAQAPAQAPAATSPDTRRTLQVDVPAAMVVPIMSLPADAKIGTINGEDVTAGELQAVLRQLPPQVQQQANSDRRKFVEQYGLLRALANQATKAGLDQQSPWKETLEYTRMRVMYEAAVGHKLDEIVVPADEVKKAYEASPDRFQQAHVRAIYIPFSSAPVSQADSKGNKLLTEAEAKAKAEDLMKQLKAGADFIKLVKEHSSDATSAAKDGDYGTIRKSDPMPADLRKAVFDAKPGEIAGPVRQANGYYIFRIDEMSSQPFEQVQLTLTNELKNKQFMQWMSGLQKSIQVQLVGPSEPKLVNPGPTLPQPATPPPAAAAPKK